MPLNDHKDWLAAVGSLVQMLAILGGGAFAIYKYLEAEQANRTKETLNYVDRYHKSPIHDVRSTLSGTWINYEDEIVAKLAASDSEYEKSVLRVIKSEKLEAHIFTLLSFYGSIQACSEAKICDYRTARNFFCSDAVSFYHLHYRFIAYERTKRNDALLGQQLEKLAKACKGAVG